MVEYLHTLASVAEPLLEALSNDRTGDLIINQ